MLNAGRVQLLGRGQRPTQVVPVHGQKLVHQRWGMHIIHPAVLQQRPLASCVCTALGHVPQITGFIVRRLNSTTGAWCSAE